MGFDNWLDDFFASYYRRRPVCATFIGVHTHDHELPDFSPAAREDKRTQFEDLLDRLEAFPAAALDDGQRIDRQLAEGALRIQQWENDAAHYVERNPAFYTGKAVFGVISIFLRDFSPLEDRVPDAVARMEAIPGFLDQARANLGAVPTGWSDRAIAECDAAIALFEYGLGDLTSGRDIGGPAFAEARTEAADSFREFRAFLQGHEERPDGHACGTAAFERLLAAGHQFDRSPATLAEEAREEMARQEAYLEEHAADFDVDSRDAALSKLETDHPDLDAYYDRYGEVWRDCRERVEKAGALSWPDYPIEFLPRPEWVREAAENLYFLYYRAPAAFDDVAPVEYLVEPIEPDMDEDEIKARLRQSNNAQIKLNHVVHHGGVGHHVQNYRAYEQERSRIGQMAAVDCASRVALYAGATMAEGWATYATELMDELGFLTALESYSLRYSRLRYAARTVVDVGLHTGEMNYEEAVAFYRNRVGMGETAARYEATKNSMFPGMAVLYLRPLETVHELRSELESALGDEFDLGRFHDEFLSYGSVPVTVVAERIREEYLA